MIKVCRSPNKVNSAARQTKSKHTVNLKDTHKFEHKAEEVSGEEENV